MFETFKANKKINEAIIAESEAVINSAGSGANQRYHAEAVKNLAEGSEALNKKRTETIKAVFALLGIVISTGSVVGAALKMDSEGKIPVGNAGKLFGKLRIG